MGDPELFASVAPAAFAAQPLAVDQVGAGEVSSEDSDWNLILRNLTEAAVQEQQDVSDFEGGFTSLPEEVTLRSCCRR
jgi:hypothetical protein